MADNTKDGIKAWAKEVIEEVKKAFGISSGKDVMRDEVGKALMGNFGAGLRANSKAAVKAFIDVVSEELKKGNKVQLVGFGTFDISQRAAREGRNPQTGDAMEIQASRTPKFKAGKALKDLVNGKK